MSEKSTNSLKNAIASIISGAKKAGNYIKGKGESAWKYVADKTGIKDKAIVLANYLEEKVIKKAKRLYDDIKNGSVIAEWNGKIKNKTPEKDDTKDILNSMLTDVRIIKRGKKGNLYTNEEVLKNDVRAAALYVQLFMRRLVYQVSTVWADEGAIDEARKKQSKSNTKKNAKEGEKEENQKKYSSIQAWCNATMEKAKEKKAATMTVEDFLETKLKINEKLAGPLGKVIETSTFDDLNLINLLLSDEKIRDSLEDFLSLCEKTKDEAASCVGETNIKNLKTAANVCGLQSLHKASDLIKKIKKANEHYKKWVTCLENAKENVEQSIIKEDEKEQDSVVPQSNQESENIK